MVSPLRGPPKLACYENLVLHTHSWITVPKWCKDARSQWSIGQRGYTQLLSSIKFELHKMIRRNAETCREIYRWQVADASIWIRVVQLGSVNIEALCLYKKVLLTGQANCFELTAKIIRCDGLNFSKNAQTTRIASLCGPP